MKAPPATWIFEMPILLQECHDNRSILATGGKTILLNGNDDIAIVHRLLSQYSLLAGEVSPPPPSLSPFWSLFFAIFNEMNVFSETWFIWLNWLQNTIPEHLLHPGTSARVYPVGSWPMATNVLRRYWRVAGLQPVPVTMGRGELGS